MIVHLQLLAPRGERQRGVALVADDERMGETGSGDSTTPIFDFQLIDRCFWSNRRQLLRACRAGMSRLNGRNDDHSADNGGDEYCSCYERPRHWRWRVLRE